MDPVTGADLLALWEASAAASPLSRPLALLAAAGEGVAGLADLPLGERDQRLLALRRRLFGSRLPCRTRCPACGEPLELSLEAGLLVRPGDEAPPPAEVEVEREGLVLVARPPTTADLLALEEELALPGRGEAGGGEGGSGVEPAARLLAERCVVRAERDGEPVAAAELTPAEADALAAALAAADPRAELLVALDCEACGHRWREAFDVAAYLTAEVEIAAHRLLRQVHLLARGYGWREADVLALPPLRRRAYLEMLGV